MNADEEAVIAVSWKNWIGCYVHVGCDGVLACDLATWDLRCDRCGREWTRAEVMNAGRPSTIDLEWINRPLERELH